MWFPDRCRAAAATVAQIEAARAAARRIEAEIHERELALARKVSTSCPGGAKIFFRNRSACRGQLVADLNDQGGQDDSRPTIEHIIWNELRMP